MSGDFCLVVVPSWNNIFYNATLEFMFLHLKKSKIAEGYPLHFANTLLDIYRSRSSHNETIKVAQSQLPAKFRVCFVKTMMSSFRCAIAGLAQLRLNAYREHFISVLF